MSSYSSARRWAAKNVRPSADSTSTAHHTPLIRVGSARFMSMEGIALPAQVQDLTDRCQAEGHSQVCVALSDDLAGCIELQPTVRPEAQQIIKGLQERGIALYIIEGDQEAPTRKLAQELGITGYFANTLRATLAWRGSKSRSCHTTTASRTSRLFYR